ncbi:sigma factor-like helix-turn-helix DNA-binding protein [Rugamonas rubra]|uniref:Sigma-70 region 2 n=1 Tax=Rugamonas rubra TaxID=758825 RepID=A0A1I4NQ32_9BURK|nr:sigma factor-like helix-turn-helix DNA-binding protein [Rugamonas rubra]SFM17465.1 Sigma-70 region 2 [Rugamonas rubra]
MSIEPTDETLMLRYRDGDLGAFQELYRRHSGGLYLFLAWRSPRRDWVDEIAQDSWIGLHQARARYQPQASFRTYLYQKQFSGMSLEEIAALVDAPVETVKSRLRYAMRKLREQLSTGLAAQGEQA